MIKSNTSLKISVITPSFNQGRFIEDAIQSVLDQNYPNFEHIVIDACSTDNTLEVLQKYPHLKWVSEPDEGQSDALNKGFRMATGDIICWLNADDLYFKGTFAKAAAEIATCDVDGVYGIVHIGDVNKNVTKHLTTHKPVKFMSVFFTFVPSETLFIHRRVIENNIFIDKSFHITMDKEFVANILHNGYKLKYIKQPLAYFRLHETNKSKGSKAVRRTMNREGVEIINRYWNLSLPINAITARLYRCAVTSLKPVRKAFKIVYS